MVMSPRRMPLLSLNCSRLWSANVFTPKLDLVSVGGGGVDVVAAEIEAHRDCRNSGSGMKAGMGASAHGGRRREGVKHIKYK